MKILLMGDEAVFQLNKVPKNSPQGKMPISTQVGPENWTKFNLILQTGQLNFKKKPWNNKPNLLRARPKKAIDLPLKANSALERVVRKVKSLQIPEYLVFIFNPCNSPCEGCFIEKLHLAWPLDIGALGHVLLHHHHAKML